MLDAPVPVSAVWSAIGPTLQVAFSTPLVATGLLEANWFVRKNNLQQLVQTATASLSKVFLTFSDVQADVGPDVVSYSPPPFDVISDVGRVPAPAFSDYPIT